MSDLPEGWVETTFEEVADIQLGKMLDKIKNVGEPVPYLRNINVRWGGFDLDDVFTMKMSRDERQKYSIQSGDLIVCEGGEPGRAAIWREQECQFAFQKALMRVRSNGAAMPDWMHALLIYASASGDLSERFTGTTIKHLPQRALASTSIPLPPLAEQRRIVEKLDALSEQSRAAATGLTRIETLITRYRAAVLAKVFPESASLAKLDEVIESTFYGPRFSKSAYADEGIVTLRTTDFTDLGEVVPRDPPKVVVSAADYEKWGLVDGDLLVTRTGSIGKCAVYDEIMGPALPSAYLIRVRLLLDQISPRYAFLFLQSPSGQSQLGLGVKAVTQPNINAGVIRGLELPLPPLEEQAKIVARIESAFAQIETLANAAAAARARLNALDRAILARAFQGKLVPQNANDEPASELLKRVKENAG